MILQRSTAVVWTVICDGCGVSIGSLWSRAACGEELRAMRWRQRGGDEHYCPDCAAHEVGGEQW